MIISSKSLISTLEGEINLRKIKNYDNLEFYNVIIGGYVCVNDYPLDFNKNKATIVNKYKVTTESDGKKFTIYNKVTDGFGWDYPIEGNKVYRLIEGKLILDTFEKVVTTTINNKKALELYKIENYIGLVIDSFPSK